MSFIQIKTTDGEFGYIRADTVIGIMPHGTNGSMILYTGGNSQELSTFAEASPEIIHHQVDLATELQWQRSEKANAVAGELIVTLLLEAINSVIDRINAEAADKDA